MARFDLELFPSLDRVVGSPGGDLFVENGPPLTRTLAGLGGNDTYQLDGPGQDVVVEFDGGGIDVIHSAYRSIELPDFVENLVLDTFVPREADAPDPTAFSGIGNALNNRLVGNDENNLLDGRAGADTLDGGAGDDVYVVDSVRDVILDSGGEDLVRAFLSWTLDAFLEGLVLEEEAGAARATGNADDNGISGNSFANLISGGAGNDRLRGGGGNDTSVGGAGDDTYTDVAIGDVVVEAAGGGIDHVYAFAEEYVLAANVERLTLGDPDLGINGPGVIGWGNALDNGIGGNGNSNLLYGLAGDDKIVGGIDLDMTDLFFDTDTMVGGIGNDTYEVDSVDDYVLELANEGTDTIEARISFALPAWVENLTLLVDATALQGRGNDLANRIEGNAENNLLEGYGGNDSLIGGAGDDTLRGGRGNDTYEVNSLLDVVQEAADSGLDEVVLLAETDTTPFVLADFVERLILRGPGDLQQAVGNASNNYIAGGAESRNLLNGGGGTDTLVGGTKDDTYVIDSTADVIVEVADGGKDWLRSSITVSALLPVLENIELTGSANLNATGNLLDNRILGNSGTNVLAGLAGNDFLDGGAGADTLNGGAGDDTYIIDDAGDVVLEAGGRDMVVSSLALDLTASAALLQVEAGHLSGSADVALGGNALSNVLVGNTGSNLVEGLGGNDWLSGGAGGVDTLIGGAGDDTYNVSSAGTQVTENPGEGRDLVVTTALATYTLGAALDDLRMVSASAVTAIGNILANRISTDRGNDSLNGGAGNDTLVGGAGDDTYGVDSTLDVVVEIAGAGVDLVISSATYVLSAHVEGLELTGINNLNGTGNALANSITGNDGNNVLDGGAGNDTLDGGAGADTLRGGLGEDVFEDVDSADVVVGGAGIDTVRTALAAYTLLGDVENLEFTGAGAATLTGNALNNRIVGGGALDTLVGLGGNDYLDGGVGPDQMDGGLGNDTYVVDDAGDLVTDAGGIDTIIGKLAVVALTGGYAAIDNLVSGIDTDFTGTGNAGANLLVGGAGDDSLDGGAGADTLQGGLGNDVYFVDNAGDRVVERPVGGLYDEVRSTISYTLGADLEGLVLLGSANISGTGNARDNFIQGNSGNNVLNGGAGNDIIDGNGGNDSMIGGLGNDVFVWDGGDTVAGGAGDDALVVTATSLDLQALADTRITGIEYLDLLAGGVDVTVRATAADILALSDSNRVIVDGNTGDALELVDPAGAATWTNAGQDMIGGILYQVWQTGLAEVFVDTDVTVTIL